MKPHSRSPFARASASLLLAVSALFARGCSSSETVPSPGSSEGAATVEDTSHALSSTEPACITAPADAVFPANTTGRSALSNRRYHHPGCYRGYLIDIENYSSRGTLLAYAGATPTTQTQCERSRIFFHVWRKNPDGTATHIGNRSRAGRWVQRADGTERCVPASIVVDDVVSEYVPGGNYRIAVRADDRTESDTRREIYVETFGRSLALPPTTGFDDMQAIGALERAITALPSGSVHPALQGQFDERTSPTGQVFCRWMELELSLLRVGGRSYLQTGVTPTTLTQRTRALESTHEALCGANPSVSAFQTAVLEQLRSLRAMAAEIQRSAGVSARDAAELLRKIPELNFARIFRGCEGDPSELAEFLLDGTVPADLVGADVLLRNCAGSASQIGERLGIGGRLARSDAAAGAEIRQCLQDAIDEEFQSDECAGGDPRAAGAPDREPPAIENPCPPDAADVCTEEQNETREAVEAWLDATSHIDAAEAVSAGLSAGGYILQGSAAYLTYLAAVDPEPTTKAGLTVTAAAIGVTAFVVAGLDAVVESFSKHVLQEREEEAYRTLCSRPGVNCGDDDKRCLAFDLNPGTSGVQDGEFAFYVGVESEKQLTFLDRIEHCLCQGLEPDYFNALTVTTGNAPAFGGRSAFCPNEDDQIAHECYADPFGGWSGAPGPTDEPDPRCVEKLAPSQKDRDALLAQLCEYVRPDCDGAAYLVEDGQCGCAADVRPGDPVVLPGCQEAIRCEDSVPDARTCKCQPLDAGGGPCFGGGLSGYLVARPSDLVVSRVPRLGDTNWLMVENGTTSVVTPAFQGREVADRTTIEVEVLLPETLPPSGYKGQGQLLCSNPANNVFNRHIATQEFRTLPLGTATVLEYPLDAELQRACWGNGDTEVRLEWKPTTDAAAPERTGFSDILGGLLTPPVRPPCVTPIPRPDPGPLPVYPGVTDLLRGDRPIDWRLSDFPRAARVFELR